MASKTIEINAEAFEDLMRIKEELDTVVEYKILPTNPTRYRRLHYDLKGNSIDESKKEMYLEKIILGHRYR